MRIGWIGAGQMGVPMASNLLAGGHEVCVCDPKPAGVEALAARGATAAGSIAEVCADAEVVFSSIPDDTALRTVALAPGGAIASLAEGATYVDMSTVSPGVSQEVARAAAERAIDYLRAPVSGSTALAEAGTLTVMVSGPAEAYARAELLFALLGANVFHVGGDEQARYLKLVVNNIVHATAVAIAESLAVGRKGGLDWAQMIDVIAASAIGSPLLRYKADPLKERDFAPASYVATSAKDQALFVAAAAEAGVPLDIAPAVADVFAAMTGGEDADRDFFATVLRAERAAGLGEP